MSKDFCAVLLFSLLVGCDHSITVTGTPPEFYSTRDCLELSSRRIDVPLTFEIELTDLSDGSIRTTFSDIPTVIFQDLIEGREYSVRMRALPPEGGVVGCWSDSLEFIYSTETGGGEK